MKACKVCNKAFEQYQTTQKVCSPRCALDLTREKAAQKRAKETRQMKRDFNAKDRSYQLKKAEEACNAYIRERDKGLPCISCRKPKRLTAGHYKSVGSSPALRFNEDNIHGQCWWDCNRNKSGNIVEYRKALVEKIGIERVEWLEGPHEPKNYTLDEIIEIKEHYRAKLKELRQQ